MFNKRKKYNQTIFDIVANLGFGPQCPKWPGQLAFLSLVDQGYDQHGWEAERTAIWIVFMYCVGLVRNGDSAEVKLVEETYLPKYKSGAEALVLIGKLERSVLDKTCQVLHAELVKRKAG